MKKPIKSTPKEQTIQTMEEFERNLELDMLEEHEDVVITKELLDSEIKTVKKLLDDVCQRANSKYKYSFGAAQDGLLLHCKQIALTYMRNQSYVNDDEIELLWNYILLSSEYLKLLKMKHGMLNMQVVPWVEMNQGLEECSKNGATETANEVFLTKSFREIEFLSVQFVFLYHIFETIVQERNIFVQ